MTVPSTIALELPDGVARLTPLTTGHAAELLAAGCDASIWTYLPEQQPRTLTDAQGYISRALAREATGAERPFAIVSRADGRLIGSTRYLDIQPEHFSLEIGWTWISAAFRRTRVNTECKYLLMRYAFETLRAVRVQLKTDGRNLRSQNAIMRIGALYEGRLRRNRIMSDGYVRDTAYFSVLADEWPGVKLRLEAMLARTDTPL